VTAAAHLRGIDGGAAIAEQNFEAGAETRFGTGIEARAENLDGQVAAALIAVADDVGQGFVDGAGDGATVGSGKSQSFGETLESAAPSNSTFGLTPSFSQKRVRDWKMARP